MREGRGGLEVRGLIRLGFLFATSLVLFGFFSKKPKEAPLIQRAVVIENNAIVYKKPDFDAKQLAYLNTNTIVAVSTQIYRPKNLFGSFYRIFLNKPHKIRGYISEIDVIPQYRKTPDGFVQNTRYQKKEKALKSVQQSGGIVSIGPDSQNFLSEVKQSKNKNPEKTKQKETSVSEAKKKTNAGVAKKENDSRVKNGPSRKNPIVKDGTRENKMSANKSDAKKGKSIEENTKKSSTKTSGLKKGNTKKENSKTNRNKENDAKEINNREDSVEKRSTDRESVKQGKENSVKKNKK